MSILDEIKLPKGSPDEELEQLSKNKLRPLFDIELFEFRPEEYRDKGLDLAMELKYKGSNTNFRFLIQLKSTGTKKPNSDGSYSWQIDTSNIQYLLNGGLPAYYICYVKQNDKFYYKQINDFINEISQKNEDWNSQDSHTLRTSDILNKDSISLIYQEVKNRCEKTREITERLHLKRREDKTNKVSITSEYQITDETSIVDLIEKNGFTLIDEGRSKDIVFLSEKISNDITSSLFNLIVGVAQYYTSHLLEALVFFQKSKRQKGELSIKLQEHLEYFDAICKYSTGYINEQEYSNILDSLKDSKHLSYYIKIDTAKKQYAYSKASDDNFEILKKELFEIIDDSQIKSSIRFIARSELLLIWGSRNNMDLFRTIALLNAIESEKGVNKILRIENAKESLLKKRNWERYYKKLCVDLEESKDIFAYSMFKLNEIKVRFEFLVFSSIIKLEENLPGIPPIEGVDNTDTINKMLKSIDIIADNYRNMQYIDNLLVALATKFEVFDFIGEIEKRQSVAKEMQELIEFYDLKQQKIKLDYLLDNGTSKDMLLNLVQNTIEKSKSDSNEYYSLVNEMKILDEKEADELQSCDTEIATVTLFPIGNFSIPKNRLNEFYDILKIDSYKLIKDLDYFFDNGIIPVLNIFNEIKKEGYINGKLDDKGIESWRRIRDIRVALFEKKLVRKKMNYRQ